MFGFRLQISVRPRRVEEEDEKHEEKEPEYENYNTQYDFKVNKTRNALNGRQKSKQAKAAELSNDIRKSKKYWAKVMATSAHLELGGEVVPVETKPTKHHVLEKNEIRKNKRSYKTEQQQQSF